MVANSDVGFSVAPGEIHALLGENGAGKSTLVKIIYGVLHADEGEMLWDGKPVRVADPKAARALGIGMVFQHFSLFEAMTVLENVALGVDGVTDMKALAARVREVSHAYGLPLDPEREVHTLSVGERQRIEIVRCLLQSPRLLIMDEPTSVLTPQEVDKLFETLRQLAAEGCSILYISHKLHEIKALCDRATILRGGKVVGACDPKVETAKSMAQLMIGAEVRTLVRREGAQAGEPRLTVHGLDLPSRGAARRRPQAHRLRGPRRRDLRHRRGRRQRPERAAAGAVRRAHRRARHHDPHRRHRRSAASAPPGGACSACAACPRSATATPPCPR